MLYEVLKAATGLEPGETYSPEELAKKGDVNTMVRKKIVRPVGFIEQGQPLSDSEAGKLLNELQEKLVKAEDERDEARAEVKALKRQVDSLLGGHAEGARQLKAAQQQVEQLQARLDRIHTPSPAA
jgi:chromosome segregation ATPase